MRILHVWDQSGVASILAKYQRRLGHESIVIKRKGFDKYGIMQRYPCLLFKGSAKEFYTFVLSHSTKYDIAHVHSLYNIVPLLKLRRRMPIVMHFHGSEVRGKRFNLLFELVVRFADKVLVSTPDLLSLLPEAEWLPNPVDTELFHPHVKNAPELAKMMTYADGIPYHLMPSHLKAKGRHEERKSWGIRKTSLEALAVGTPVIWNGLEIMPKLPEIHRPENVVSRTLEIYNEVLGKHE